MPLLNWEGRDGALTVAKTIPYRLLKEDRSLSYGDPETPNLLIHGDNLDSLKALMPYYGGRVKCVFIDPPYNTQSAFVHYDDAVEHAAWLSLMTPRLQLLRDLLAEDGTLWVTIDDAEGHYLKVLLDELLGRENFIGEAVWVKTSSVHNNAEYFSSAHDSIYVYAKRHSPRTSGAAKKSLIPGTFARFNRVPRSERNASDYRNPDNDPRGPWADSPLHVSLTSGARGKQYAKTRKDPGLYKIDRPVDGEPIWPPPGRTWAYSPETVCEFNAQGLIYWGPDGTNQPRIKRYLNEAKQGVVPTTVWGYDEVGHNQEAKKDVAQVLANPGDVFATPKPERLIERILTIATNPGDLVLDSFLGSGTTAAVAHKMGRSYIGIESGDHAISHCVPRLKAVIDGDQHGISKSAEWHGGGGFRFYNLGNPVLDEYGSVREDVKFRDLAALLWFLETGQGLSKVPRSPFLGEWGGVGRYLLFNGILGDRRPNGGNILTSKTLAALPTFDGPKIVYGEATRLGLSRLESNRITFKQIPHDLRSL